MGGASISVGEPSFRSDLETGSTTNYKAPNYSNGSLAQMKFSEIVENFIVIDIASNKLQVELFLSFTGSKSRKSLLQ